MLASQKMRANAINYNCNCICKVRRLFFCCFVEAKLSQLFGIALVQPVRLDTAQTVMIRNLDNCCPRDVRLV